MTIGEPHKPPPYMSGKPFNRPTNTVLSPDLDYLYVTDGYGNPKVHKFTVDGKWVESWGESGSGPGEFNLPHAICCDADGWLYVADRENHRIQVFDLNGRYETQINNLHRPGGLCLAGGASPIFYVGELGPYYSFNRHAPNLGPRISIMTPDGTLLGRLAGDPPVGNLPGQFMSTHSVAVDSTGQPLCRAGRNELVAGAVPGHADTGGPLPGPQTDPGHGRHGVVERSIPLVPGAAHEGFPAPLFFRIFRTRCLAAIHVRGCVRARPAALRESGVAGRAPERSDFGVGATNRAEPAERRRHDDDGGEQQQPAGDGFLEEDHGVAVGDLQRLAQRVLHQRSKHQRQYKGSQRDINLLEDVPDDPRTPSSNRCRRRCCAGLYTPMTQKPSTRVSRIV